MKLIDLRDEFLEIKNTGYNKGFTIQDYKNLRKLQNNIDSLLCAYQQKWNDLYVEITELINVLYRNGLCDKFNEKKYSIYKRKCSFTSFSLS